MMKEHERLRRMEMDIDHHIFGYGAEITEQLDDISVMRVSATGMRSYLPEYTRNMNDAIMILNWCATHGGGGYLWTKELAWCCRLVVDGIKYEAVGDTPAMAISTTAMMLCEARRTG